MTIFTMEFNKRMHVAMPFDPRKIAYAKPIDKAPSKDYLDAKGEELERELEKIRQQMSSREQQKDANIRHTFP